MIGKRSTILFASLAVVLVWTGCSSGEDGASRTTAPAKQLAPRTKTLLIKGQKAFQQGEYERATAFLDSADRHQPNMPVVSFNRARVYTALNRVDAARQAYQKALALDPEYPAAHLRLGDLVFQQGNLREALRLYREEEKIEPTSPLYVRMGETYARLGTADSARIAYEKAVSLDSTNANAHMMYGQFLEETGDLEAALEHSRQALSIEPDRPNYQFAVGSQLYQLGRTEEAIDYLRRAADARLLHYPAQYTLGQALMRLGQETEAEHYLARADSSRQLMDQITAAQGAASSNPKDVKSWTRLGELFRRAGERNRAIQAFNMAASIEPRNLSVQHNMAEMMLAEGKTEQAVKRFQAIVNVDRTRTDTWISLGLAHAVAGNCEEARRAWETALEQRPDDPTAKEYLAGLCQYTAR